MDITLNQFIPLPDYAEALGLLHPYHQRAFREVPIPTEVVVFFPQVVTTRMARIYRTNFYIYEGKVLDDNTLTQIPGFRGTRELSEVLLVEVWENQGDDGHCDYHHLGWKFISEEELKKAEAKKVDPTYHQNPHIHLLHLLGVGGEEE